MAANPSPRPPTKIKQFFDGLGADGVALDDAEELEADSRHTSLFLGS